ncbi:hypothetical protein [Chroococcidiopsis sp. CCNUC1]|uniref:hypothetical protein n=1 Tax=Chroococcidiopsis sp. CCNUC1 TaxID=2653189 RepID=UPI00201FFE83|nr:hypothetical protein [Chroococcidiopsis sp. CCNUC1]URD51513.1 hypothetical protein M5J74_05885 [Chroococcidiopsis sp. CCNUC1]
MYKTTISKFKPPLATIFLIPPTVTLCFIAFFSVNAPLGDQWDLVSLFEKVLTGKADFEDFFAQHNEHRTFFPKLIFVGLALISNWNIKYELYFSVFLVGMTFLLLYKLSLLEGRNNFSNSKHLTNFLTCILLFSIIQYENWLWGYQLLWFLINACLAVAVLIIASSNNFPKRLYLAAIPCFIASFSAAHGLLTWLAVMPSIASIKGSYRQKIIRITVWILLLIGTFTIYFIGYQKPSHHPDTLLFLKHPLGTLYYFFTLLGAPIVYHANIPLIVKTLGAILFSTFFLLIFYFVKYKSKFNFSLEIAPWVSIGLFAILFALITTLGRLGYGESMSSRYTTCSILLVVAVAHLWRLSFSRNVFITSIFIGFIFMNSINRIPPTIALHQQRLAGETCLELIKFINNLEHSCLEKTILPPPLTSQLRKLSGILEEIGFRKFPKDVSFITEPAKNYGRLDSPPTEGTLITVSRNGTLDVAGWASLPDSQEIPNIVLFSYGDRKSFFADALVNPNSPIVDTTPNSIQFNKVEWSANISFESLPPGETVIQAWVYEPVGKQFIKLDGEIKVNVVE